MSYFNAGTVLVAISSIIVFFIARGLVKNNISFNSSCLTIFLDLSTLSC